MKALIYRVQISGTVWYWDGGRSVCIQHSPDDHGSRQPGDRSQNPEFDEALEAVWQGQRNPTDLGIEVITRIDPTQPEVFRYEEAEEPTTRVTKFFGRIYVSNDFLSHIGTKMAEEIVDALNAKPPGRVSGAAPELLAALQECMTHDQGHLPDATVHQACEALAKAEGREHSHFCPEWDEMFIRPSDPEWAACQCFRGVSSH